MADAKMHLRLRKLVAKAIEKEWWAVELCATRLLEDVDDLDYQINLVGALHEAGSLQNVLKPYWNAWRSPAKPWVDRCVDRLRKGSNGDYWAVASLLGLSLPATSDSLEVSGYEQISAQRWPDLKRGATRVHLFGIESGFPDGPSWAPAIELGFRENDDTQTVVHAARYAAVIPLHPRSRRWGGSPGRYWGEAVTGRVLTAKLPYGSWRVFDDYRTIEQDTLLP
ncbi:MAG: hypothetical protein AAGC53_10395 [Actinomycetota bacterium]